MRRDDAAALLAFQLVWWACAIGARNGSSLPALCAGLPFIAWRIARAGSRPAMVLTVVSATVLGAAAELLLLRLGFVVHPGFGGADGWPPAWIVVLWAGFGAVLDVSSRMIVGLPRIAAASVGAALAYAGGSGLGAIALAEPMAASLVAIAGVWAVALPCLLGLVRGLGGGRTADAR